MVPKVLILQSEVSTYNIPVYKLLSSNVELTLAYTLENNLKNQLPFKILKLEYFDFLGFKIIKNSFRKLCNSFDVVIFMADLHYISFWSLLFFKTKTKLIPWSIGIRASYKRPYSLTKKKGLIDIIYGKLLNKADSIIFYMKDPISYWDGIIENTKIFVAHNTVDVIKVPANKLENLNSLLFIGSLYKEKMIFELLESFNEVIKKYNKKEFFKLNIAGSGSEYDNIKKYIDDNKLTKNIFLLGPVYDENEIAKLFSTSLLCISPNQSGLSVLKSMGYGVAFVTRSSSITGGERLNIDHNYNGILYNTRDELCEIIENAHLNKSAYYQMGRNAKNYYLNNATTKHMVKGFIDAINYALLK